MALLLTNLATFHANIRSTICAAVGCTLVTIFSSDCATLRASEDCSSTPPPTRFRSYAFIAWPPSGSATSSTRTFCLAAKMVRASGVTDGAITTSTNWRATASAAAPSSVRLKAMMPPKAEVGSVLKAFV